MLTSLAPYRWATGRGKAGAEWGWGGGMGGIQPELENKAVVLDLLPPRGKMPESDSRSVASSLYEVPPSK